MERGIGSELTRLGEWDDGVPETLRLGHELRFVLVAVGGGAIRVAREIARRRIRYLETVAINCDPRVQEIDEFDHRVCLSPETGPLSDTGGSPTTGGLLARAAEPALARIFDGATFVTVLGSLGGGAGTGALPYVLEAAARASEVLSVFLIRPFEMEQERRRVADRALARLHFVDALVEKQQRHLATVQVLDNQEIAEKEPKLPIARLNQHWAELVAHHVEQAFLLPAEASFEAARLAALSETTPVDRLPPFIAAPPGPSVLDDATAGLPPTLPAAGPGSDAELTFEVDPGFPGTMGLR